MKTIFAFAPAAGFTWRRCLVLCLPALIIGALLRISLLATIPEGFYASDSNSYFITARELHLSGSLSMPAKRAYLYPLFLVPLPWVPFCNTVQAVAVLQHALGLLTVFGIGWIAGHLVRRPTLWVPLVTLVAAVWPRMLIYEHEMVGESLMLAFFVAAVAVIVPPGLAASPRRLVLFSVLALAIMATKPAGRPLWAALVVATVLVTRRPFSWPWKCYATLPVVAAVVLTTGGDGQGPWLFLSSTLPFVRTEGEPFARERAILRPAIESARTDLLNYAYKQHGFKKMLSNTSPENPLGPEYVKLAKDKPLFSKVAKTLGREAVLAHPAAYLRLVGMKIICVFGNRHDETRLIPDEYWRDQEASSAGRWERRRAEMALIYEMDEPAYRALVAERSQRQLWIEPFLLWIRGINWLDATYGPPGQPPPIRMQWMGWLTLLGLLAAFVPGRCVRNAVLWLPPILYLVVIYAVGDSVARYLHPLDWLFFILVATGLDTLLDVPAAAWRRFKEKTKDPRSVAT